MNLLTEPLLPIDMADGRQVPIDLPGLLALLARHEIVGSPFLRPHQRHPWHAFCVQLAALALHRAGETDIAHPPERWRELLRGLTAEWPGDEPWQLVVADLGEPAFMQPPVPERTLAGFKNVIEAPDDLDVLVTSKNHGVKQGQMAAASPAEWAAVLVSLQTTGGFLGAGNYGIARMNGGFATRPGIGLVPEGGPAARWRRDVTLLLRHRGWFFERVPEFGHRGEHALLWCLPWDGRTALGIDELDPWFVEVCRRVRLMRAAGDTLVARTATSAQARIAGSALKGNLADPWTPINKEKESAAYNSLPTYAVMSEVLFDAGKWARPLLLDWHAETDRAPMLARFDVFVRGQGKTEGYHERVVPIGNEARQRLLTLPDERERVAGLARNMVKNARELCHKVLRPALMALIQGGPESVKFGDRTAGNWADKLVEEADRRIDRVFFEHLLTRAEDEAAGLPAWLAFLRDLAKQTFETAVLVVPLASARRQRAIAVAEGMLWRALYRTFDALRPTREDTPHAA